MEIDEAIEVELTESGAPVRFTWRGVIYGVVSAPEPWVGRRAWWRDGRAARAAGERWLERELWRVDAVPLTGPGPDGTFDLLRDPRRGWSIAEAWNDDLDQRLFA
ncbi:hypothetical protein GCM10011490_26990 [Pseudoclavibacter endophyticus]|uniref:DUF6504 domain-containing protein n=1 Tax=Pseudoclavibacter endophyticus TaxID=1778590 RepID=A0A6H9WFG1_9MICO|nr:DUF6504 family protein [Pseudoclavibacter endophyticus]KAB1646868.1 hypothetical protein F8O04_14155 [Pseudoclavibacter endophyticus]GGA74869.1 hypothetical protein GCM10011490_26990 [Pseudoclavibacter endophyticus]